MERVGQHLGRHQVKPALLNSTGDARNARFVQPQFNLEMKATALLFSDKQQIALDRNEEIPCYFKQKAKAKPKKGAAKGKKGKKGKDVAAAPAEEDQVDLEEKSVGKLFPRAVAEEVVCGGLGWEDKVRVLVRSRRASVTASL